VAQSDGIGGRHVELLTMSRVPAVYPFRHDLRLRRHRAIDFLFGCAANSCAVNLAR